MIKELNINVQQLATKCDIVLSELYKIYDHEHLLKSKQIRIDNGSILFTNHCPFAFISDMFQRQHTFPYPKNNVGLITKRQVGIRIQFWEELKANLLCSEGSLQTKEELAHIITSTDSFVHSETNGKSND